MRLHLHLDLLLLHPHLLLMLLLMNLLLCLLLRLMVKLGWRQWLHLRLCLHMLVIHWSQLRLHMLLHPRGRCCLPLLLLL